MKFLHLGDLHIGKVVNGYSMLEDQEYMLNEVLSQMVARDIRLLIVAGDVYDRDVPSEAATVLWDGFLRKLAERGITLLAISGNHDSEERLAFGNSFMKSSNIYIANKFNDKMESVTLEDEYGPVTFWLLPYVKLSQLKRAISSIKNVGIMMDVENGEPDGGDMDADDMAEDKALSTNIDNYTDAMIALFAESNIDTTQRNVIVSHQFVVPTCKAEIAEHSKDNLRELLSGSESMVQSVGGLDNISVSAYESFDYVALGHIHRSCRVGRETVRYSGSLLKYSIREANSPKSFPEVTLGGKGNISVELLKVAPLHDLKHLTASREELLSGSYVEPNEDDYIYVTLTDDEERPDVMAELKAKYPLIMHMDYKKDRPQAGDEEGFVPANPEQTYEELLKGFFQTMRGNELTESEWKLLNDVAKEVGLINEAN